MGDEIERILELVAEGHLTPDEAAPIIEALGATRRPTVGERVAAALARVNEARQQVEGVRRAYGRGGRRLRIRVTEHGRQAVNLTIPLGFVDAAVGAVPGISGEQAARIRDAIDAG